MKERWKMNRIGFVNFWLYDEEDFEFEDGKLLLDDVGKPYLDEKLMQEIPEYAQLYHAQEGGSIYEQ